MRTEEKEESKCFENKKILDKTRELTALLKESKMYQDYYKKFMELKKFPDLYNQLNVFRRKNLELQMQNCTSDYEDKAEELQKQYTNILMEPVVTDFLLAEQALCQMLREMYDVLYQGIHLDISYMDEE